MKQHIQYILKNYINFDIKKASEIYLEKYWLNFTEYQNSSKLIKDNIFCKQAKDLPDLMFKKNLKLIAQRGGIVFSEEEYLNLQQCMQASGDKYFFLIENKLSRSTENDIPHLRFKFPIDTTWEEINNGDENYPDISFEAIFIMNKHFFVFGDSGNWGKYSAGNYNDTPLDIIGFKPEISEIFKESFKQSKEDGDEIRDWLPAVYKDLIKKYN